MKNVLIEEMLAKFSEVLARSPAKDMEHNAKALMKSLLQRMDVVDRTDLEAQQALLSRALERLSALEARVTELESAAQASTTPPASE